jgi:hypothetical protein
MKFEKEFRRVQDSFGHHRSQISFALHDSQSCRHLVLLFFLRVHLPILDFDTLATIRDQEIDLPDDS